jgi:hypothetical protein
MSDEKKTEQSEPHKDPERRKQDEPKNEPKRQRGEFEGWEKGEEDLT